MSAERWITVVTVLLCSVCAIPWLLLGVIVLRKAFARDAKTFVELCSICERRDAVIDVRFWERDTSSRLEAQVRRRWSFWCGMCRPCARWARGEYDTEVKFRVRVRS